MVCICSSRITESLLRASSFLTAVCAGSFALVFTRLAAAAAMTIGLCLLPASLERISTNCAPSRSEPVPRPKRRNCAGQQSARHKNFLTTSALLCFRYRLAGSISPCSTAYSVSVRFCISAKRYGKRDMDSDSAFRTEASHIATDCVAVRLY